MITCSCTPRHQVCCSSTAKVAFQPSLSLDQHSPLDISCTRSGIIYADLSPSSHSLLRTDRSAGCSEGSESVELSCRQGASGIEQCFHITAQNAHTISVHMPQSSCPQSNVNRIIAPNSCNKQLIVMGCMRQCWKPVSSVAHSQKEESNC